MKKYFTLFLALSAFTIGHAQIVDSSFEAGTPNPNWTEYSTNFGTPICDAGCGSCGGPCVPRSGNWYVWFGGAPTPDTGYVEQSVTFPMADSGQIAFWLQIPTPGDMLVTDEFAVFVDGVNVGGLNGTQTAGLTGAYVGLITSGAQAYFDGNAHTLRFQSIQSTDSIFNVIMDDVSLIVLDPGPPTSIPLFLESGNGLSVYPNPASTEINIDLQVQGFVSATIYSTTGASVREVEEGVTSVDIRDLPTGTYQLYVVTKSGTLQQRFVKE